MHPSSTMAISLPSLLLVTIFLHLLFTPSTAQIPYPCHTHKERMGDNVTCTTLSLPRNLCSSCPLRPPGANGNFAKCWDIFDTSSPSCLPAMQQYILANPCDTQRGPAVTSFTADPTDDVARGVIDYFLYSVCEQCCDCIPMGANRAMYVHYLAAHTADRPTLYDPTRGNCPAHAVYDVCTVAPQVAQVNNIGSKKGKTEGGEELPAACPMLKEWLHSRASHGWQENPKTEVSKPLEKFLSGMLSSLQCERRDIWERCYALEEAQDHLGVPEDPPEVTEKSTSTQNTAKTPSPGETPTNTPVAQNVTSPNANAVSDAVAVATSDAQPTPDIDASCFPSSATVALRGGAAIPMSALRIGDEVLVRDGEYSPVYLFSHRDPSARARHVRVAVSSGAVLTLTAGHLLVVNGRLKAARTIVVGDRLEGVKEKVTVRRVGMVEEMGLYNPHTVEGSVVVDGVVCSCYTEAVGKEVAIALLAPLRAVFRVGGVGEGCVGGVFRRGMKVPGILRGV